MPAMYTINTQQIAPEIIEQMKLGNPVLVESFESPSTILMPMTAVEAEDYEYTKYLRKSITEAEEYAQSTPNAWLSEEETDAELKKLHS